MGFSNIKTWIIYLALISMVVIQVTETARVSFIHPGVLDPCKRSGDPHPGCHPNPKSALIQVNAYNRGCSRHHKCRH